ncbi:probable E3 ubiquitin-protein ligase XERICO [Neltuma alba]|uniref:probable E3 ubiquitin-protein ligase XERICO n=1 Tax=Neltuma alba TaxID=207710 RepID=UPI0010A37040|nr:probable E3 ubiquitin-protein ligase XERICO [Prosopis alba]
MGLSNIPNLAEGVLPVLVVNTVLSVVLLKNMLRSVLEAVGVTSSSSSSSSSSSYSQNMEEDTDEEIERESWRRRRVSITQYKVCQETTTTTTTSDSGPSVGGGLGTVECSVCLCGFEANQEVSELPCKHFFHTACLDKWFNNKHLTCPLCRSID